MRAAPTRALVMLLPGSLLAGLGHIALLPPFEGFDETAHYAYIQQIAETGRAPRHGEMMSTDIDRYLRVAPSPELMQGAWTYQTFFAAPAEVIAAGQRAVHAPREAHGFAPGQIGNWQAQHPPLYYALLAPAYLASKSWSLGAQLFLLRALSYLIAWSGLCITVLAALRILSSRRAATLLALAAALWPVFLPGWLPEMARLGNDSLIALLAAFILILLRRVTITGALRDAALLGSALALALLTKATALPVVAASFMVLAGLAIWRGRTPEAGSRVRAAGVAAALTLAIGGWWYLWQMLATGSAIGSNDEIRMRASGGLIAGLAKNLNLLTVIRAPWDLATSFLWSGTWSFVLAPRVLMLPLIALALGLVYGCWRALRSKPLQPTDWFALLTLSLFVAALGYHSVILLSIVGAVAPAWYLHALAPILALLTAHAMAFAAETRWTRGAAISLALYALLFLAAMTVVDALQFAGCAVKVDGRPYAGWTAVSACLQDPARTYDNLAVLTFPGLGSALFAAGWLLLLGGTILTFRAYVSITSTR